MGTSHLVGNVVIESVSETEIAVRSRFQMMELRRDATGISPGRTGIASGAVVMISQLSCSAWTC